MPPTSHCRLCGCAVIWAAGQLRPQMQGNQQKFLRSVLSEHVWLRLEELLSSLTQFSLTSLELSEARPVTLVDDSFSM